MLALILQPLLATSVLAQEPTEVEASSTTPSLEIETGAATSVLEIETAANTTVTETPVGAEAEATTTEEMLLDLIFGEDDVMTVTATNTALVTTEAESEALTGENTITEAETATIITGDGYAVANVVNLVNTNILNSDGLIQFFTTLGLETLDVRDLFSVFDTTTSESTPICVADACGTAGTVTESTTDNEATIHNNVVVRAATGENSITESDGGSIDTGDAIAAANIFNLANTNIVDSNYLLVSINNLGDLTGDIVLPAASLLESMFGGGGGVSDGSTVANDNTANLNNDLSVGAETGLNQTTSGEITTGEAVASGQVYNQVNQNLVGGDSFLILLRVHGNWSGDIFGLPNNMLWEETPEGIVVYNAPADASGNNNSPYFVSNTNTATVNNNVSVYALTGENKIDGEGSVNTGNAYASASITNLLNLNILSQNWVLLIFDIFGDWGGNIAFGRPDLWVGVEATSVSSPIMPGSIVDYTYTVANLGDTKANNVTLDCSFATNHLAFSDGEGGDNQGVSERRFNLGSLNPGETRKYTYQAKVGETLPSGTITTIPLSVEVAATENEDVLENNSDTIAVEAGVIRRSGGGGSGTKKAAELVVTKEAAFPNTTVPALMDYTVTITNNGGPVYNAILSDFLRSEDGTLIHDEFWDLDTIASGETVTVTYTMEFSSTTKSGIYTNSAQVTGNHRKVQPSTNNVYQSGIASSSITITNLLQPLLAAELLSCDPYLKTHMRRGYNNDSAEVLKLQTFLKEHLPYDLSESGQYDSATEAAVSDFQERYRSLVLDPWGISEPTGYVYLTTKKAINEIICRHEIAFPLTPDEEQIIAQSRFGN